MGSDEMGQKCLKGLDSMHKMRMIAPVTMVVEIRI
jgi:hypothetical protein